MQPLLDALGAELAATRKVTDKGWQPRSRQVGITGRSISPRLYVAVGLSGKFNHMVGVRGAGKILAINSEPGARCSTPPTSASWATGGRRSPCWWGPCVTPWWRRRAERRPGPTRRHARRPHPAIHPASSPGAPRRRHPAPKHTKPAPAASVGGSAPAAVVAAAAARATLGGAPAARWRW